MNEITKIEEAGSRDDSESSRGEWLRFLLDGQSYALNVLQVQEILCFDDVTPVPSAPDYVLGVINVRGNIVTVVDASKRIGLCRDGADRIEWIVILDADGEHIGLLVDEVLEVNDIDEDKVEQAPSDSPNAISGVIVDAGEMTVLLDARSMLGLSEAAH